MTSTAMIAPVIEVRGLRKSYGTQVVLDSIDLTVAAGTVTALLGPNGAGKTTTVHIHSTLMRPDGGSAFVNGCDVMGDPGGVRLGVGLTGQFSAVDKLLTGEENLLLMARLRHLGKKRSKTRVAELLDQFDLVEAARKPLATYSGGMQRRLDLAMTLVSRPLVIFLDEPTTGLDPRSRHTMWDIVRGLVSEGTTVLLTTQNLEEADELADRIAVRTVAESSRTAHRTNSSTSCPAGTSDCDSQMPRRWAVPPDFSTGPSAMMPGWRSPCRATAGSVACVKCSTASMRRASRSTTSASTARTWMTCSSP
jgi:ABC-type Na+ transport system ATPase subunit NatA